MLIQYFGRNNDFYENEKPIAVITYNENKEQQEADIIFELLRSVGWNIEEEEGCGIIPVVDKWDFNQFKEDYKLAKRKSKIL